MSEIKVRERNTIIKSLSAGVVPSVGLQHIQVGRAKEVEAIIRDLEILKEAGSSIRFVVGDFGSGKTFFLNLSKVLAHKYKIVTAKADITMEKTLYATDGKSKALFTELIKSLAIKSKPSGNALKHIIEKWLSKYIDMDASTRKVEFRRALEPLKDHVAGYDFSEVLNHYLEAYNDSNGELMNSCLKWLRGEFRNISSAKAELPGIRSFIDDSNYYDYIKLYASFFRLAGYNGLLICIDELVNLTRQTSNIRTKNYETILKIYNDLLQSDNNLGLMFIFSGTNDFVFDTRKGLHSYGALKTRLARSEFKSDQYINPNDPLIELDNLSQEEYFVLFKNLRNVFAKGDESQYLVSDSQIKTFLDKLFNRMGASDHMTARDAIKEYITMLSILDSNPNSTFAEILKQSKLFSD